MYGSNFAGADLSGVEETLVDVAPGDDETPANAAPGDKDKKHEPVMQSFREWLARQPAAVPE